MSLREEVNMANEGKQFCIECRKETKYHIHRIPYKKVIKDKEYTFQIFEAVCDECGEPVNIHGLMDLNAKEVDRQYRAQEGVVNINDITTLMNLYNIGKAPLSLALGFGEITITRYLTGQVPSKEYSQIIQHALESPAYMSEKLDENVDKIGETAYKKATKAIKELEPLTSLSEKMLLTISYVFKKAGEVTPLALQKMLYYIQGMHMTRYGKELFQEDCEAWANGPVYRKVYEAFRSFKYNPIDDTRFAIVQNRFSELTDPEQEVIDMVVSTFGMYSGKTLEEITHKETPWIEARGNCLPEEHCNHVISKESIKEYFAMVSEQYDMQTEQGIRDYINSKL